MTTYNITDVLYEEIAERCADNATFTWDCIMLNDGFAVIFGSKNGQPYDVEVLDEDNGLHPHDFDFAKFKKIVANL